MARGRAGSSATQWRSWSRTGGREQGRARGGLWSRGQASSRGGRYPERRLDRRHDEGPGRRPPPQDDSRLRMETRVLTLALSAGLPVATCLWSAVEPRPVIIQSALRGSRLADIEPPFALLGELTSLLRRIHAIPIEEGFGTLSADLHGAEHSLPQWFTDRVRNEASGVSTTREDDQLLGAALARFDVGEALLSRQKPGLVHGDIQPFNVLVEDEGSPESSTGKPPSPAHPRSTSDGGTGGQRHSTHRGRPTRCWRRTPPTNNSTEETSTPSTSWFGYASGPELIAGVKHGQHERATAARTALTARL